jgi:hypothetical protein
LIDERRKISFSPDVCRLREKAVGMLRIEFNHFLDRLKRDGCVLCPGLDRIAIGRATARLQARCKSKECSQTQSTKPSRGYHPVFLHLSPSVYPDETIQPCP